MNTAISPPQATPICTQQASVTSASATPLKSVLLATAHAMSANPTIPMIHHTLTRRMMTIHQQRCQRPQSLSCGRIPGALSSTQSTPPGDRSSRLSLANFGAGIFDRDPVHLSRTQLSLPRLDLDADPAVPSWQLDLARRLDSNHAQSHCALVTPQGCYQLV